MLCTQHNVYRIKFSKTKYISSIAATMNQHCAEFETKQIA